MREKTHTLSESESWKEVGGEGGMEIVPPDPLVPLVPSVSLIQGTGIAVGTQGHKGTQETRGLSGRVEKKVGRGEEGENICMRE